MKHYLIGRNSKFLAVLEMASRLKGHKANVLITGPSGSGKEMVARFIHDLEGNASRPFIPVNCAAIPENLLESELFGHERGAFTGAVERKIGKFELAEGGDIFLDELGTLKPELQSKLLRVLQDGIIQRVGGREEIKVDFRVISATNEKVSNSISNGTFREDLYHRVAIVDLQMPALKDRSDDIPMLTGYFLSKYCPSDIKKEIAPRLMHFLCEHEWPGNIRELENVVHNLVITSQSSLLDVDDLPPRYLNNRFFAESCRVVDRGPEMSITTLDNFLETTKAEYVVSILGQTGWNLTEAAKLLNMGRSTLHTYIKTLQLETVTVD
ncbi:MAG: sigma-54 dependent transcriptional regulator [Deltaproteobacteria bacterium]|nr:sigma-54 dependent transcriptional regulator [Deltaproteobacteria bacterium]